MLHLVPEDQHVLQHVTLVPMCRRGVKGAVPFESVHVMEYRCKDDLGVSAGHFCPVKSMQRSLCNTKISIGSVTRALFFTSHRVESEKKNCGIQSVSVGKSSVRIKYIGYRSPVKLYGGL